MLWRIKKKVKVSWMFEYWVCLCIFNLCVRFLQYKEWQAYRRRFFIDKSRSKPLTSGLKLLFSASEKADSNTDEEFEPIAITHGRRKSDDFLKLNKDDWIE